LHFIKKPNMDENYLRKALLPLLLATPLILLTPVIIPTQQAYAQEAGIRLLNQCANGAYPQWLDEDGAPKDTVTYKLIVKSPNIRESQINAVREGIERWDGFVYNIEEVGADEDADIVVTLAIRAKLEAPEVAGNAGGVGRISSWVETGDTCTATAGEVILSMKSASAARSDTTALANLAEHEFGHALNLGHSNYEQDIMFTRRGPNPLWAQVDICPSNLDVEALTAQESPYFVEDWEELNC
jgi:predicted Zn-dependent protease